MCARPLLSSMLLRTDAAGSGALWPPPVDSQPSSESSVNSIRASALPLR